MRRDTLGRVAIGVVVVGIALSFLFESRLRTSGFRSLEVTGVEWGKDFRLRDPEGRARTLADFRGNLVMVFFGFTQCPDICPTALVRASEVKRLLGSDGRFLQVIFVTLDPERDTPGLLKAYTGAFDPDFVALAGDRAATDAVARSFRVYYRKVMSGSGYTLDHSAMSYVFDPYGRLRLAVEHAATAPEIAADLKRLLAEMPH